MDKKRVWKLLLLTILLFSVFTGCAAAGKIKEDGRKNPGPAQEKTAAPAVAGNQVRAGDNKVMEKEGRLIKVTFHGDKEILFALNDSTVSRSFYKQLPLTAVSENYGSNEKTFQPPKKLDCGDGREGACPKGTIAYFSPWNNVCLYYGDAPRYPGLYVMGKAVKGAAQIGSVSGTIKIEAVTEKK